MTRAVTHDYNPLQPAVFPAFFGIGNDPDGNDIDPFKGAGAAPQDDLPYKVELWNAKKTGVELVLAVTANSSIGYAAFHAATREYPDRYVTFRHKNRMVAKINGPEY